MALLQERAKSLGSGEPLWYVSWYIKYDMPVARCGRCSSQQIPDVNGQNQAWTDKQKSACLDMMLDKLHKCKYNDCHYDIFSEFKARGSAHLAANWHVLCDRRMTAVVVWYSSGSHSIEAMNSLQAWVRTHHVWCTTHTTDSCRQIGCLLKGESQKFCKSPFSSRQNMCNVFWYISNCY